MSEFNFQEEIEKIRNFALEMSKIYNQDSDFVEYLESIYNRQHTNIVGEFLSCFAASNCSLLNSLENNEKNIYRNILNSYGNEPLYFYPQICLAKVLMKSNSKVLYLQKGQEFFTKNNQVFSLFNDFTIVPLNIEITENNNVNNLVIKLYNHKDTFSTTEVENTIFYVDRGNELEFLNNLIKNKDSKEIILKIQGEEITTCTIIWPIFNNFPFDLKTKNTYNNLKNGSVAEKIQPINEFLNYSLNINLLYYFKIKTKNSIPITKSIEIHLPYSNNNDYRSNESINIDINVMPLMNAFTRTCLPWRLAKNDFYSIYSMDSKQIPIYVDSITVQKNKQDIPIPHMFQEEKNDFYWCSFLNEKNNIQILLSEKIIETYKNETAVANCIFINDNEEIQQNEELNFSFKCNIESVKLYRILNYRIENNNLMKYMQKMLFFIQWYNKYNSKEEKQIEELLNNIQSLLLYIKKDFFKINIKEEKMELSENVKFWNKRYIVETIANYEVSLQNKQYENIIYVLLNKLIYKNKCYISHNKL